jgi:phosphoglycolate phosphatase
MPQSCPRTLRRSPSPGSSSSLPYILWDWNGTLLDDTDASIAALNAALRRRGLSPIARDWYREHFSFPVRPFYAACGIDLEHEDWDALAREYHDAYAREPKRLNAEALAALSLARQATAGQSIVSALRQDLLDAAVDGFKIRPFFDFTYGTDNLDGASKLDRARELLRTLTSRGVSPASVVLIGDALHDKEVADALGVRCVLCAQGGHSAARLRAAAPTAPTLLSALSLVLGA